MRRRCFQQSQARNGAWCPHPPQDEGSEQETLTSRAKKLEVPPITCMLKPPKQRLGGDNPLSQAQTHANPLTGGGNRPDKTRKKTTEQKGENTGSRNNIRLAKARAAQCGQLFFKHLAFCNASSSPLFSTVVPALGLKRVPPFDTCHSNPFQKKALMDCPASECQKKTVIRALPNHEWANAPSFHKWLQRNHKERSRAL